MESCVFLPLFTLLLLTPKGLSKGHFNTYNSHYYYDYDDGREEEPPIFQARSQTFTVEVGQSVIIPCDVDNAGTNKLIMKKVPPHGGKDKLLAVGDEKVTRDPRISIEGARLTISHALPRDSGTFLCEFELEPPVELRHSLDVQFPPTVRSEVPPEQYVPKGRSVTLACKAQGNPEPIIRWSRQEGPLPSGHKTEEGQSITLEGVDRHVEGTYLCTAGNGIGESASAAMTITVEYPPEITTEKEVVRTGEGDQVELVCLVHGRPAPDVIWTRDGHPLPDTAMDTQLHLPDSRTHDAHGRHHINLLHIAHRHTLSINNVTEKDFGAYVCIAENSHGLKEAVIQMTGLPKPPLVTSSPHGGESSSYTITWETESYYPISEFLIKYRKAHMSAWQPSNRTMVMAGSWKSVSQAVRPIVTGRPGGSRHSMAHTLHHLDVATDYLAIIRVRNKYGWSSESKHFAFSTKKAAMAIMQSTSSGTLTPVSIPVLLLIMALTVC